MKSGLEHVKDLIKKGEAEGAKVFYEEQGSSIGPVCACCGGTDREFIGVMVIKKDEDPYEDSAQYIVGMFGKTCFKKSGIKAMHVSDFDKAWKKPSKTSEVSRKKQLEEIRSNYGKKKKNRKMIAGRYVETFIKFLEGTLIPDLKESGQVYTAKDFETAIKWIKHYKGE